MIKRGGLTYEINPINYKLRYVIPTYPDRQLLTDKHYEAMRLMEKPEPKEGVELKKQLRECGITQRHLSKVTGIEYRRLSQILNNHILPGCGEIESIKEFIFKAKKIFAIHESVTVSECGPP